MPENLAQHYLENVIAEFRYLKKLGDPGQTSGRQHALALDEFSDE